MTYIDRGHLGVPGNLGLVVLVCCLYFYLAALLPAEEQLARLEATRSRQLAEAGSIAQVADMPKVTAIPDVLKQLNGLTEASGLEVDRVTYQFKDAPGSRRLLVTVPVLGSYPEIRAFVRAALAMTAYASLDEFDLQRTQATDTAVTARIGLSYQFEVV